MASNLLKPQGKTGTEGIWPGNCLKTLIFDKFSKNPKFQEMASNLFKPQGQTGTEGIRPGNYPKIVMFITFFQKS